MDVLALQTLQEIRDVLYVLTAILSVVFFVWVLNWISNIKANFKKAWDNDFISLADKYFESADFDKLTDHCEAKIAKQPNHAYAIWWLARTRLEKGETAEAKALFERALELEPSWKESHINLYLEKLKSD